MNVSLRPVVPSAVPAPVIASAARPTPGTQAARVDGFSTAPVAAPKASLISPWDPSAPRVNVPDAPVGDLRRGQSPSYDPQVHQLQSALVFLDFMKQSDLQGGEGLFGPKTEAAVKAFQAAHGLPATGVYDWKTKGALRHALGQTTAQELSSSDAGQKVIDRTLAQVAKGIAAQDHLDPKTVKFERTGPGTYALHSPSGQMLNLKFDGNVLRVADGNPEVRSIHLGERPDLQALRNGLLQAAGRPSMARTPEELAATGSGSTAITHALQKASDGSKYPFSFHSGLDEHGRPSWTISGIVDSGFDLRFEGDQLVVSSAPSLKDGAISTKSYWLGGDVTPSDLGKLVTEIANSYYPAK